MPNQLPKTTTTALFTAVTALLAPYAIPQSIIDAGTKALLNAVYGKTPAEKNDEKQETRLVSFSGAARLTTLSRSTIYELVRQGRLDVVELSGTRKITMRSINEFLGGKRPANEKTAEAVKAHATKYAMTKEVAG